MMEVVRTSETSVNNYLTTRQYIPEDSKLHSRRRENLKSQNNVDAFIATPEAMNKLSVCVIPASSFVHPVDCRKLKYEIRVTFTGILLIPKFVKIGHVLIAETHTHIAVPALPTLY
jgi:hypothetical protein